MSTKHLWIAGITVAMIGICGCAQTFYPEGTPLERNWGKSYEAAKYNQILDPEAGKNTDPVTGLDGEAVSRSNEKYRKSFETAPPRPVYNINISGVGE